jgi:hypothetical protein
MRRSGIILIVLGCLFLANNFGLLGWDWLRQWWPLLLIALGVWTVIDQRPANQRKGKKADDAP